MKKKVNFNEALTLIKRLTYALPSDSVLHREASDFIKKTELPILAFRVVVAGKDHLVFARNRDRARYITIQACLESGYLTDKRKLFSTSRVRRAPEHDKGFTVDEFEKCLEWSDTPRTFFQKDLQAFSFKF